MRRKLLWRMMAAALMTMSLACSPAMAIGYLSGVLNKPAYVQTLTSLLDAAPGWTREILKRNGPYVSSVRATENIAGTSYEMFKVCVPKPACVDTTIAVMFAPNGTQAWAGLREKGVVSYLGSPSEAQQAVLKGALYVPEPTPVANDPYLFDVLKKPAYARAAKNLLGQAGKLPSWIGDVFNGGGSYNSTPLEPAVIDGIRYEVFSVCTKEYSCIDTHLAVMFAPNGAQAWGLLVQEGTVSTLGAPTEAQLAVMRSQLSK